MAVIRSFSSPVLLLLLFRVVFRTTYVHIAHRLWSRIILSAPMEISTLFMHKRCSKHGIFHCSESLGVNILTVPGTTPILYWTRLEDSGRIIFVILYTTLYQYLPTVNCCYANASSCFCRAWAGISFRFLKTIRVAFF